MSPVCRHVYSGRRWWKPEVDFQCLPRSLLHFTFWDRVCHWTSSFLADQMTSETLGSSCLCPTPIPCWDLRCVWSHPAFVRIAGISGVQAHTTNSLLTEPWSLQVPLFIILGQVFLAELIEHLCYSLAWVEEKGPVITSVSVQMPLPEQYGDRCLHTEGIWVIR